MNREEIIQQLESITKERGFIYTLALLLHHNLFYSPEDAADINWYEKLSFQELSFLVGLAIKHPLDMNLIDQQESASQDKRLVELFELLHRDHMTSFVEALKQNVDKIEKISREEKDDIYRETMQSAGMVTEPIFYGDSGAYDFQYWQAAPKKYQNDSEWLIKNKQFDASVAAKISECLKRFAVNKVNKKQKPDNFHGFCESTLSFFTFNKKDLKGITGFDDRTINDFLKTFSITPGNANKGLAETGEYNEVLSHPIIKLDADMYFFTY